MIEIVPYMESWPNEFTHFGLGLRDAVGDLALSIHHIGSTSVPGLDAKDVIDIQMTVADLGVPIEERLVNLGYAKVNRACRDHCPPGMTLPDRELEKCMYGFSERRVHLHVRVAGRFNQRYPLLCREYLRAHPYAAQAYGEIKRQLAKYFPENVDAYYDVKDPVFDVIMVGATAWAEARSWNIPPSDA